MAGGTFSKVQAPVTVVHSNLDQEIIQITEDRLRLVLKDHIQLVEDKKSWIAPTGMLLAIIAAFVTADFRDYYFKSATWEAIFVVSGVLTVAWLVRSLIRSLSAPSIDDVVEKIKRKSGGREG